MHTWSCRMLGLLSILAAIGLQAAEIRWDEVTLRSVLEDEITRFQALAREPLVVNAVKQQNSEGLSWDEIQRRDQQWRTSDPQLPLKQAQIDSELGRYLQTLVTEKGAYSEIFVIDAQGVNVAVYPLTTDYWQGDEEKWRRVAVHRWQVYVSPMEYDESSKSNAVQISVPVMDGDNPIGVLTVGIRLSHVLARQVR